MTAVAQAPTAAPSKLKSRSEVSPKDCWDLSSLYANEAAFEKDFRAEEAGIAGLAAFKGKLGEGAATVRAYLDLQTASDRRLDRLFNYASRNADVDTQNSHFLGMRDRVMGIFTRRGEAVSFFRPELLALPDATLDGYERSEALAPYRFIVAQLRREKPYVLTDREERLLALAADVTKAPYDIFGQLNNADLRFGSVKDEQGRDVEVTHGSYSAMLSKRDRRIRKEFFETYYAGFDAHKHTFAATLAAGVKRNCFYAKARGHKSARAAALFGNAIPESVYDNLIAAVHEKLPALHRYYDVRKKLLKLDEIHAYDTFVPVVPAVEMRHTYEEGVAAVIEAVKPLGEDYVRTLEEGLLGGWVDRYENRGKRSGAYSSGSYDSAPFILLNYKEDNLDHVYTLAHEAGHSMHSFYSKRQPPQYADYSIFVAEVASTFNEALLTRHLLAKAKDKAERAYIINREIDAIRGTLYRQTMFAEYEHRIHARVEAQETLSLDDLKREYKSLLLAYFGPRFTLDAQLDIECLRIPHFYYNFYVFQYATGISAAFALASKVLKEGAPALAAYKGFLAAGSSAFPIDVLKTAGVDMTSPEPVRAALAHFEARVSELEALLA